MFVYTKNQLKINLVTSKLNASNMAYLITQYNIDLFGEYFNLKFFFFS